MAVYHMTPQTHAVQRALQFSIKLLLLMTSMNQFCLFVCFCKNKIQTSSFSGLHDQMSCHNAATKSLQHFTPFNIFLSCRSPSSPSNICSYFDHSTITTYLFLRNSPCRPLIPDNQSKIPFKISKTQTGCCTDGHFTGLPTPLMHSV